ncbi:hypothetical protein PIB30_100626 [Stylosanthes scabra]|uniref:Putative plant transposon protein domain-containing protein n=1 Tax=Stylosanthes scabra TaxID=79078 RepID=A0ABU6XUR2_9FABA|nr:hypothetical protein [Stylosanthes scabra]
MASKGKGVTRQPSTRTCCTSSRRQASQEAERFETPIHAERREILIEWKRHFPGAHSCVEWEFMYNPVIPINMTLVREFYANRDQREVYMRGRKIPCFLGDIERVLHIPRLEGASEHKAVGEKYDNNKLDMDEVMQVIGREGATWPEVPGRISSKTLNKDAWMWMKLIVCNIMPTRQETTLGADHILLIYALMKGMTVSLLGVMVSAMNEDPTKYKRQLLPFPMFITKWAEEAGIPTFLRDEIFNVPKAQQFFPYGIWDPAPPALAPVPPPAARTTLTNTPASSHSSSSQPSRNELMRALRRNEHVMCRHEQLLLMLHPNIDTSQLQQISSLEVSE